MIGKKKLFFMVLACAGALVFISNASGPGNRQGRDRSGSPVADGTCANCHMDGSFSSTLSLTMTTADGDTITEYVPESTYTLRVEITAEGAVGFGFQSVILDGANASTGNFGTAASGTSLVDVDGRMYWEQSERAAEGVWEIEWTAPAAGAGDVTVFSAGNSVNGNGSPGGDEVTTAELSLTEGVLSSLRDQIEIDLVMGPNPTREFLELRWDETAGAVSRIGVMNATGEVLQMTPISSQASNYRLDVNNLSAGLYYVRLAGEYGISSRAFVKL